jgi:hypothetical protein
MINMANNDKYSSVHEFIHISLILRIEPKSFRALTQAHKYPSFLTFPGPPLPFLFPPGALSDISEFSGP